MKRKNRLFVGGTIITVLVGYLVWSTFAGATQSNKTVSELVSGGDSLLGKPVRLTGKVVGGTLESTEDLHSFDVTDGEGVITLEYRGTIPNSFQPDADVIADGALEREGVFVADVLLVKCPSKYEAKGISHPDDVSKDE